VSVKAALAAVLIALVALPPLAEPYIPRLADGLQPLDVSGTQAQRGAPCAFVALPSSTSFNSPARGTSFRLIVRVSHVSMG
jgi:hypothetical protein